MTKHGAQNFRAAATYAIIQYSASDLYIVTLSALAQNIEPRAQLNDDRTPVDFFERFSEFNNQKDTSFVDLDRPVKATTAETLLETGNNLAPIVRIQSKMTPFLVRKSRGSNEMIEIPHTYHALIEVYNSRYKTKHLESVQPLPRMQVWNAAEKEVTIYVRDRNGMYNPFVLEKGKLYVLKGGVDGRIRLAVNVENLWEETNILRFRFKGLRSSAVYTLSPNLASLKRLQALSPEDLMKERSGIKIVAENFDRQKAKAGLAAASAIMKQVVFAEGHEAYVAREDPTKTGLNTRLRPEKYQYYVRHYARRGHGIKRTRSGQPIDDETHFAHQPSTGRDQTRDIDPELLDDEEREQPRLRKRHFNVTVDLDEEHDHMDYYDFMDSHLHEPEKAPEHWELKMNDGNLLFQEHTLESLHKRSAELMGVSVEEAEQEHRLFKRGFGSKLREAIDSFKGELSDSKSIVVSSEGDHLLVKIFKTTGKVVRKVLTFVSQALEFVRDILAKIGVLVKKMVQWMTSLFHWSSYMNALRVSNLHSSKMPVYAIEMMQKRSGQIFGSLNKFKNHIIGALDEMIEKNAGQDSFDQMRAKLQNEAADAQQNEDLQSSYMADMITHGITTEQGKITCSGIPGIKEVSLSKAVAQMVFSFKHRIMAKLGKQQLKSLMQDSIEPEKFGNGMFAAAVVHVLKFVRNVVEEVFEIGIELAKVVTTELMSVLKMMHKFMNCEFAYTPLTELWTWLTHVGSKNDPINSPFTLAAIALVPGTFAFVVMYKMHNIGQEPFDNHDVRALLGAQRPLDYMTEWTRCQQCRSLEELSVERRVNTLSWLFGYQRIFMSGLLSFHEPVQRVLNKFPLIPLPVARPIFHFMHHMMSFPLQLPDKKTFNSIALKSWEFGLPSLVFASTADWGGDLYDDLFRVLGIGIAVLDNQYAVSKELTFVQQLNPLSGRALHWKLKGLSQILNSVPILPGVLKLEQYALNNRLVATVLDKVRMDIDMFMNWKF